MLENLHIKNYALIKQLDITFHEGFTVITGETGAGKSIILGAIELLQGKRADIKSIKNGEKKCTIEAFYDLKGYALTAFFERHNLDFEQNEGSCIIRRELLASGKSRAFINDTPVSLSTLKELTNVIIDIHSQHKNLLLEKESFLTDLLDTMAQNKDLLNNYHEIFDQYTSICKKVEEATETINKEKANQDFLIFQTQQLEEAKLQEDEQKELEQKIETLNHVEDIKQRFFKAEELFESNDATLLQNIKSCANELLKLEDIYPEGYKLGERLESNYLELKDIANEISYQSTKIEFDPKQQNFINERLNTIYTLEQKHQVKTCAELLKILDHFKEKLNKIENSDEYMAQLKKQKCQIFERLEKKSKEITLTRKKSAKKISKLMADNLKNLGLPNVIFEISITPRKEYNLSGFDKIEFLFSANKNVPVQNIAKIASGGEIARVMLSLKAIISDETQLSTIIFDEIDTGVSGHIADMMARMMLRISKGRQVISISHLPQIAAAGNHHYKVYKTTDAYESNTHISELKPQERIEEIAHMLSGNQLTDAAINNAKTLLEQANKN